MFTILARLRRIRLLVQAALMSPRTRRKRRLARRNTAQLAWSSQSSLRRTAPLAILAPALAVQPVRSRALLDHPSTRQDR